MVIEYRTVEVYREIYVRIDDELTQPVEIVEVPEGFDTIAIEAARKQQRTQAQVCNMRLHEISLIEGTPVPETED